MSAQDMALQEEQIQEIVNKLLDVFKPCINENNLSFLDIAEVLSYAIVTCYKVNIPDEHYHRTMADAQDIVSELLSTFKNKVASEDNSYNIITQLLAISGFASTMYANAANFSRKNYKPQD